MREYSRIVSRPAMDLGSRTRIGTVASCKCLWRMEQEHATDGGDGCKPSGGEDRIIPQEEPLAPCGKLIPMGSTS